MFVKDIFRKILPVGALRWYHKTTALLAACIYRYPSRGMITIGVTGTNGKSTTCYLIAKILERAGFVVGLTSSVHIKIGEREELNTSGMTMQGRFALERLLHAMRTAHCTYAVVESSSQGIEQFRHVGIEYDILVFTNLTPEHVEAHGGFENYKAAKGKLFAGLAHTMKKCVAYEGPRRRILPQGRASPCEPKPKSIVVNGGDEHAPFFLSFWSDEKYVYGLEERLKLTPTPEATRIAATNIQATANGNAFSVGGERFELKLPGVFNVENALAAISVGLSQGIEFSVMQEALYAVEYMPGRVEYIREGQDFSVIVDYAPEPAALRHVYAYLALVPKRRLIHVLGSAGGGRDKARRPILGEMAGKVADIVFVTNEDPYDEDPLQIMHDVAAGARAAGKEEGRDLFVVPDRQEAIRRAIAEARQGDLVLLTGKGAEQAISIAHGKKIPWDERAAVRRALHERKNSSPLTRSYVTSVAAQTK